VGNFDEIDLGTDPRNASDTPGAAAVDELKEEQGGVDLSSDMGLVLTVSFLVLIAAGVGFTMLLLFSSFGRKRSFLKMEGTLEEAEGFEGIAEVEEELDALLRKNDIGAAQGILIRNRIDDRREALEEEMRISQQSQQWAWNNEYGQQQQAGWQGYGQQAVPQQQYAGWGQQADQSQWWQQGQQQQ
jgi:hypothetical protein